MRTTVDKSIVENEKTLNTSLAKVRGQTCYSYLCNVSEMSFFSRFCEKLIGMRNYNTTFVVGSISRNGFEWNVTEHRAITRNKQMMIAELLSI